MLKFDGTKLLNLMFKFEISVGELAKKSGVAQPTISELLKGTTRSTSIPNISRLAKFFDVDPSELLLKEKESD